MSTLQLRQKRRMEWIKNNGPCRQCGSFKKLEIDHVNPKAKDPRLKKGANLIWQWREESREKELSKCQVLCSKCHKQKTLVDYEKDFGKIGPIHGRLIGYNKYKCRCELCEQTKREYDLGRKR